MHGAEIDVIPDTEEAASLITLAAVTKGEIRVSHLNPDYLEDYFLKIRAMNVNFTVGADYVDIKKPDKPYKAHYKLQSGLYPKLNSDFLPPMAVLASQADGETFIYEWLYENRLAYVEQLTKMGANAQVLDPHRVKIIGPSNLHGAKIATVDLRMGMTMVVAALVASGQSEISDIHHIDRGYEDLEARLLKLGAYIKRSD